MRAGQFGTVRDGSDNFGMDLLKSLWIGVGELISGRCRQAGGILYDCLTSGRRGTTAPKGGVRPENGLRLHTVLGRGIHTGDQTRSRIDKPRLRSIR
jgi:hypothetical protein